MAIMQDGHFRARVPLARGIVLINVLLWGALAADAQLPTLQTKASALQTKSSAVQSKSPASGVGVNWQELPGNPSVIPGSCLSWRCAGTADPTSIVNPDGTISTWFTTIGIAFDTNHFLANGPYIGMATGQPGKMSYPVTSAVVPVGADGTWDKYVETATVRRNPDSTLTMWYMGYTTFNNFSNAAIGQMVSSDTKGENWTRTGAPIYRATPGAWDSLLVTGPTVVQGPHGNWFLYYTGAGLIPGAEGIGMLTSTDGKNWIPFGNGPVLAAQFGAWDTEILEQCVLYYRGQFWMWYSAYRGPLTAVTPVSIGLATSPDGMVWTRYSGNPVIGPGAPGSWDDLRVVSPDVMIQSDGSLLMSAHGQSKTDVVAGSIGYWKSLP